MMGNAGRTVLICDDEPHIRESIRYVVEKAGFNCAEAEDGDEAYAKACSICPDLIILDVGMPGMTGFEVCEKLRAEEGFAETTIMILTAFGQAMDERRAYEVGANHFMSKPFSPRALKERLCEILL